MSGILALMGLGGNALSLSIASHSVTASRAATCSMRLWFTFNSDLAANQYDCQHIGKIFSTTSAGITSTYEQIGRVLASTNIPRFPIYFRWRIVSGESFMEAKVDSGAALAVNTWKIISSNQGVAGTTTPYFGLVDSVAGTTTGVYDLDFSTDGGTTFVTLRVTMSLTVT